MRLRNSIDEQIWRVLDDKDYQDASDEEIAEHVISDIWGITELRDLAMPAVTKKVRTLRGDLIAILAAAPAATSDARDYTKESSP